jgi:hypothetical protein
VCRGEQWLYRNGILSPDNLTFPNFLGIGAQKAGTTWLYANLKMHPQIFMPDEKELHYFNWQSNDKTVKWYSSQFDGARDKCKGDITPAYSILSDEKIDLVHQLMPGAKLILIVRDPIERAWSAARMELCALKGRKIEDVSDEEFLQHFRSPVAVDKGDYVEIRRRWLRRYPESSLLVTFFEHINERPEELLNEVFDFLGVGPVSDFDGYPLREKVGKGVEGGIPDRFLMELRDIYADKIVDAAKQLGGPAKDWSMTLIHEESQAGAVKKPQRASSSQKGGNQTATP